MQIPLIRVCISESEYVFQNQSRYLDFTLCEIPLLLTGKLFETVTLKIFETNTLSFVSYYESLMAKMCFLV